MLDGDLAIGPFGEDDRAAVIALWRRCGLVVPHNDPDADIDLARAKANSDILVGRLATSGVVASAMVGHDGHRGWLYYVAVDPGHRRRGFARAIVAAGEAWLRSHGIRKAQLLIRETNTQVRDVYAALGWSEAPRVVMERWLEDPDPMPPERS